MKPPLAMMIPVHRMIAHLPANYITYQKPGSSEKPELPIMPGSPDIGCHGMP
jgi:hypothetical protein